MLQEVVLITLASTLAAFAPHPVRGAPEWLDFSIAGYALAYDRSHSQALVHDKRSGFYIKRSIECDGGFLSLELTRDRHDIPEGFGNFERDHETRGALEKPLPNLRTGKGVLIGDNPAKLTRRLGKPSKVERSGERKQYVDYVYVWNQRNSDSYTETYTFKTGALIQIVFCRDAGL